MNRSDSPFDVNAAHPTLADLERHERAAYRLRACYARDLSVRLAVGLDLLLRRAAARLALALVREARPCR
jgi:hypothetical protein